jgi:phospholipase C
MDSRRDFLRKAALLAAGGGLAGALPASIQKALAIDPPPGSTYLDAEHVVILMQENRSFDHCYGSLRGVRGFNDPRAITLPNGNPVWLQSNADGETYAPFRLNLQETKATWMGSLPHSWVDQVQARNDGKHDRWLVAKPSGHKEYGKLPLTLGFYSREDIPFYYSLADAFTVCDQAFCSSLTGTTPNRLHLWTGTIREQPSILSKANVRNEDVDYGREAKWTTFPERLEDAGVSWRVYQNEVSLTTGLEGEAEAWLANFTDNPLEWFTQYHVRFIFYRRQLASLEKALAAQLQSLADQPQPWSDAARQHMADIKSQLEKLRADRETWNEANFKKLPLREQNLHRKAFTTNEGDPHYRELETLTYQDGGTERKMRAPKGDVLHQFRQDVQSGQLPAVSWIVAPENFSDHPGAPWYGAWYLSETLDILTQNPEVWKKTIFILCYDENDGYFDHVPPFVPPYPGRTDTGKVSPGIDPYVEHVRLEQEQEYQRQNPGASGRAGPIGLGFRVPLVVVSPWSRGGRVCSQVFDHTSIIRLVETLLTHKTGRPIRETNISDWRRTVCGDLTSVFQPYHEEPVPVPAPVARAVFLSAIHKAQFKQIPSAFHRLDAGDLMTAQRHEASLEQSQGSMVKLDFLPRQEAGVRPACALPYELSVRGALSADRKSFVIEFSAGNERFGERAAGAPFHVYSPVKVRSAGDAQQFEAGRTWDYAVAAGGKLSDQWNLEDFAPGHYQLRAHGPNGFYREFKGLSSDPAITIALRQRPVGQTDGPEAWLEFENRAPRDAYSVVVKDLAYGASQRKVALGPAGSEHAQARVELDLAPSFGWYDLLVLVEGLPVFHQHLAGHLETGKASFSDPRMGGA